MPLIKKTLLELEAMTFSSLTLTLLPIPNEYTIILLLNIVEVCIAFLLFFINYKTENYIVLLCTTEIGLHIKILYTYKYLR